MKKIIYISGVTGGILLILRIVGIFVEFSFNRHMLLSGLLLTVISITFSLVYKDLQNQKIRKLLRKYKEGNLSDPAHKVVRNSGNSTGTEKGMQEQKDDDIEEKKTKSGQKGLELGKTSLRERKTGLVWGGGNIKGTTATRGRKKKFIKRR
jgi:hypothetical protein